MQSLAEQSRIVRLPLNRVSSLNKISKAFAALEQKYQREPSDEELAAEVGITSQDVVDNAQISGRHVSVNAPFAQGEDGTLLDVLEDTNQILPDSNLLIESLQDEIRRALSTLTSRESEVLSLYFGLDNNSPLTLEELGERFGLTRERVRQIKEKATRRLKSTNRSKALKGYL